MTENTKVRVVTRIRPFLPHEIDKDIRCVDIVRRDGGELIALREKEIDRLKHKGEVITTEFP
jgi:hypothetical protein